VVAGPPGTQERLERAFDALYPGAVGAKRAFETRYEVLEAGVSRELGPAIVTPFPARHESGAPSFALRLEYGGKVIAYSGDTEWTDALIPASKGADLFVCECNFYENDVPQHINYRTLAAKRGELECDRLVITHMSEEMLAHVEETGLEPASDGMLITL
jgi:ribonuclease BN (tRNA processing enzyme)